MHLEGMMLLWILTIITFGGNAHAITTTWQPRTTYTQGALFALRPPTHFPPSPYVASCVQKLEEIYKNRDAIAEELPSSFKRKRNRRGRRGGVRERLKRRGVKKTPLPVVTFGNVQSVKLKLDLLAGNCKFYREYRESAIIALTETWLREQDADSIAEINGFTMIRSDRRGLDRDRGGGVAAYVNDRWCTQVTVKESFCNDDIEYLVISCRPFYLPREFSNVLLFTVYIHPAAAYAESTRILENCVTKYETEYPDSVRIILGDFNKCNFDGSIPTYDQSVTFNTTDNGQPDKIYCNIKNSYRTMKMPKLGGSIHNMVHCLPTYVQVLKREKCEKLKIRQWDAENTAMLQACFETTDWPSLLDPRENVNSNLDIIDSYLNFCIDMIVPSKEVVIYPNNKPWVNKEVKDLITEKRRIALDGDPIQLRNIRQQLDRKIAEEKRAYKAKGEGLFRTNSAKDAWKGLKTLCGYNAKRTTPDTENIDINQLNSFFARFDTNDFSEEFSTILSTIRGNTNDRIVITHESVLRSLRRVRTGKATGPDNIPAKVLKYCAVQLAVVLQQLFQDSLDQGASPIRWKVSEIKPIAKITFPKLFNDFRPVVLTSNIMKCLEDIVRDHLCNSVDTIRDPLQFAYCRNRSVQDASLTLLNEIIEHLEQQNTQVRVLFIDFSSAFNTIQPHILLDKLLGMGVNGNLLLWISNYLTQRPQYTKIGNTISDTIVTNTGAPQGCVLSPLLFSLYTNDCRSSFSNCTILKYADDTVIVGKIVNNDYTNYIEQVSNFVEWSHRNFLKLNVKKTKEMIIDFRTAKRHVPDPIIIDNEPIERVSKYKYLGFIIDDKLKGDANTDMVYKKCNQRLHFARVLRNLHVDATILNLFYKSTLESILCFSISTWYGKLVGQDKRKLGKIVRKARKLGITTTPLEELYQKYVMKQVGKIMQDNGHPLNSYYVFLRSGRRLDQGRQRTNRYKKSFVPKSITLYNRIKGT